MEKIAGIDYGSKLAGTTVVAFLNDGGAIETLQSAKGQDADQFILQWAAQHQPSHLFLDAPLSLPGVYTKKLECDDYFYRKADKQTKAMSPMFLGGLTARAMFLRDQLSAQYQINTWEVYPAYLAKLLALHSLFYKKEKVHIPKVIEAIAATLPCDIATCKFYNWHQVDALLSFCSGFRYIQGIALVFGDPIEGQIIV